MTTSRKTILTMLAFIVASAGICLAGDTFRGIPTDQGNNILISDAFNRFADTEHPFYIDVLDNFTNDGPLVGSDADTFQVGFVPPVGGLPSGYLQGQYADDHGRWMSSSNDYQVSNGSVRRTSGGGAAIACLPWRVEPTLGDFYNLEMTAMVATGESVSLGYFGDVAVHGTGIGLDGSVGQLVLEIERGEGVAKDDISWTVAWDDSGIRHTSSGMTTIAVGEEINMQLGWLDQGADDSFDALLGTSAGNQRLIADNMGNAIEVFGAGFELSGTGSSIGSFTAAVPEPNTGLLALMGIVGMTSLTRRRRA